MLPQASRAPANIAMCCSATMPRRQRIAKAFPAWVTRSFFSAGCVRPLQALGVIIYLRWFITIILSCYMRTITPAEYPSTKCTDFLLNQGISRRVNIGGKGIHIAHHFRRRCRQKNLILLPAATFLLS